MPPSADCSPGQPRTFHARLRCARRQISQPRMRGLGRGSPRRKPTAPRHAPAPAISAISAQNCARNPLTPARLVPSHVRHLPPIFSRPALRAAPKPFGRPVRPAPPARAPPVPSRRPRFRRRARAAIACRAQLCPAAPPGQAAQETQAASSIQCAGRERSGPAARPRPATRTGHSMACCPGPA
jgi:hypothetical protein